VAVTLALSLLCENPFRRTGLTTLFHEFVAQALKQYPEVRWVIFAGPQQPWDIEDERVEVVRKFPSNERRLARLWADHFRVGPAARARGASALLTVGFVPLRTAGLPVIMHLFSVHHRRAGGGLGAGYRRWAVERGLREAALVIVNSAWTRSQLGEVRPPVLVSHEGVQHERFRADGPGGAEVLPELPSEYVLWASNFYGYKRAPLALAAYARLSAETRMRFPLVLVGGDWAGGRAGAEQAARALGIERDVRFLGWVDDAVLPAVLRGARVHVLATSEETFGRSVAEAMACGCPCVVQDLPVLREVAADAAMYVEFTDSAAAGAALARVCEDDLWAERMREAGVRRAQEFSFEKLTRERMEAVLARVRESR
jgi:glycosyltransferase involved in cell wall biosynthesis